MKLLKEKTPDITINVLEIPCYNTPFIFTPIGILAKKINFTPSCYKDLLNLTLINPFEKNYKHIRKKSHLTDAQTKEIQLRFLGRPETERKLLFLAKKFAALITFEEIRFLIDPDFVLNDLFLFFIKALKHYTSKSILISYKSQIELFHLSPKHKELRQFYFSSKAIKTKNALKIYEAARDCGNAGDYWSAINLLRSTENLQIEKSLKIKIFKYIGVCYRLINHPIQAEFYFNQVFDQAINVRDKANASYSIAMINILEYQEFKNIEKGEEYLENAYQELLISSTEDNHRKETDLVFNRNGYALILFKRGKVDEALKIVATGIERLNKVNTDYSSFHQSVLYYNLFQCYKAKKEIKNAEDTMNKLLKIDPKYPKYHKDLILMFLSENNYDKARKAVNKAIEIMPHFYLFHHLLGRINYENETFIYAIEAFKTALTYNPFDLGSLAYLASSYLKLEKFNNVYDLLKDFNFDNNNNDLGEIILNNKIITLLNLENKEDELRQIVTNANKLNSESVLVKEVHSLLTST